MVELESTPTRAANAPIVISDGAVTFSVRVSSLGDEEVAVVLMEDGRERAREVVTEDPFETSFDVDDALGHRYRFELQRETGRRVTVTSDLWVDAPGPEPEGCGCESSDARFPVGALALLLLVGLLWPLWRRRP